jgi:hypothetical protein
MSEQPPVKSRYERLGGVYSIVSVLNDFIVGDSLPLGTFAHADRRLTPNPIACSRYEQTGDGK